METTRKIMKIALRRSEKKETYLNQQPIMVKVGRWGTSLFDNLHRDPL